MTQATEVSFPTSAEEAIAQFGDGGDVTVLGGGTIVVPELTYGRLSPSKVVSLTRAGLDTLEVDGTTSHDRRGSAGLAPGRARRRRHGTRAVRAQRRRLRDPPPGDGRRQRLRRRGPRRAARRPPGPAARARRAGALGRRRRRATEPLEEFLARRSGRLLLDLSFEKPAASAFAVIDYPHTHEYTVLAVTGVRTAAGEMRLAATGVAGHGTRLRSAEAAASDPQRAGAAAVGDVRLGDDALASAWYREQTLPVLVRRVLTELEEAS